MGKRDMRLRPLVAVLALVLALGLAAIAVACGDQDGADQLSTEGADQLSTESTAQSSTEGADQPSVDGTGIPADETIQDGIGILGLGAGPKWWADRNNTGFVLFVDSFMYMVDCGGGTPQELYNYGQGQSKLHDLFITHYHFDHYIGLADLLSRGYQTKDLNPQGTKSAISSLDIYGPPGLQEIVDGFMEGLAIGQDLHNWQRAEGTPWLIPTVAEIDLPETGVQVIMEDKRVRVSATRVDHDVDVADAYAYRFDILEGANAGKSVVFSGDRNDDNSNREPAVNDQFRADFRELAKGATVLVHEVGLTDWAAQISDPSEGGFAEALYNHLVNSHTDAAQVVVLAAELDVPMLVLQHYGNIGADYTLEETRDIIYDAVTEANETAGYKGEIIAPLEGDLITF